MQDDQLEVHAVEESQDADEEPAASVSGKTLVFASFLVALAIAGTGWMLSHPRAVVFSTPYQAVLLNSGQVYFGHLDDYGTSNPVLTEVYYVQSAVDPQTHQQNNTLVKRGKEWHAPDRMYINPQQIAFVEPVGQDSRVMELIRELKAQR